MSFTRLKLEEKVELAIKMTDACIRICVDSIRDRQLTISDQELIEQLRERLMFAKRHEYEAWKCVNKLE